MDCIYRVWFHPWVRPHSLVGYSQIDLNTTEFIYSGAIVVEPYVLPDSIAAPDTFAHKYKSISEWIMANILHLMDCYVIRRAY